MKETINDLFLDLQDFLAESLNPKKILLYHLYEQKYLNTSHLYVGNEECDSLGKWVVASHDVSEWYVVVPLVYLSQSLFSRCIIDTESKSWYTRHATLFRKACR